MNARMKLEVSVETEIAVFRAGNKDENGMVGMVGSANAPGGSGERACHHGLEFREKSD